ncbi:hypothetical protein [Deinococcus psychrotolerans]|nr:hypothetical protein [Deinococcus psychrotolerans]
MSGHLVSAAELGGLYYRLCSLALGRYTCHHALGRHLVGSGDGGRCFGR